MEIQEQFIEDVYDVDVAKSRLQCWVDALQHPFLVQGMPDWTGFQQEVCLRTKGVTSGEANQNFQPQPDYCTSSGNTEKFGIVGKCDILDQRARQPPAKPLWEYRGPSQWPWLLEPTTVLPLTYRYENLNELQESRREGAGTPMKNTY